MCCQYGAETLLASISQISGVRSVFWYSDATLVSNTNWKSSAPLNEIPVMVSIWTEKGCIIRQFSLHCSCFFFFTFWFCEGYHINAYSLSAAYSRVVSTHMRGTSGIQRAAGVESQIIFRTIRLKIFQQCSVPHTSALPMWRSVRVHAF